MSKHKFSFEATSKFDGINYEVEVRSFFTPGTNSTARPRPKPVPVALHRISIPADGLNDLCQLAGLSANGSGKRKAENVGWQVAANDVVHGLKMKDDRYTRILKRQYFIK